MDRSRWTDSARLAGAEAWIEDRLAELELTLAGPIEQPHVDERWSTVLRVEPYNAAYPDLAPSELLTATHIATRLGWACRAINGHVPGDDGPTQTRLGMFLKG